MEKEFFDYLPFHEKCVGVIQNSHQETALPFLFVMHHILSRVHESIQGC